MRAMAGSKTRKLVDVEEEEEEEVEEGSHSLKKVVEKRRKT